jgi:regulator of protease activity HflC (stomatin/prohibitin superfamily)
MQWLWLLLVAVFALVIGSAVRIVRPFERGLVERLGKYHRTVEPGLRFIWPFVDRLVKVDMRERVIDVPPQRVITEDNVVVEVDAVVYYRVIDPVKVVYNVEDFNMAVVKLAQTNLRNQIGDLSLDETLTSREKINAALGQILDEATDKWGVKVTRVEIQRIDPPVDITEAMSKQMKAEREKRALILEAEGIRQSEITKAEGQKQAAILKAEGQAEAIQRVADAEKYQKIAIAEGEAQAIKTVFQAIHEGRPTSELITLKYLEALAGIAQGQATKIFMPVELSSILGGLAAMIEASKDAQPQQLQQVPRESGSEPSSS